MTQIALAQEPQPSIIGVIAAKELAELRRDGRFRWTAAIMILLLITALAIGWQKFTEQAAVQHESQESSNSQWINQGDKNAHAAAHFGNYAFKQSGPLSFFDNGVEPFTGNILFMEAHKQNLAISRPANDLSAIARFGDLNGAMVLQVLMPLLIIFLGFTAFAGERERGTLRQLVSIGVSSRSLFWGKALGIGGAVAMVIVPCIIVGALVLSLLSVPVTTDAFWARVGLLALSYTLYGLTFLFLTLGASAIASSPRSALMILVGFWAFTAFLAPKAAVDLSRFLQPSPGYGSFESTLKTDQAKGLDGVPGDVKIMKEVRELMKQYNAKTPADLPFNFTAFRLQRLEDIDHEVFDFHFGNLRDAYMSQRRIQDAFGVLAPVLPLRSISMGLSGTDLLHHDRYTSSAEQHRRTMIKQMNDYLMPQTAQTGVKTAGNEVFATVAPFTYAQPSIGEVLSEYKAALLLLAAWAAAALIFGLASVDRLRPSQQ